jgi:hypothetical protein
MDDKTIIIIKNNKMESYTARYLSMLCSLRFTLNSARTHNVKHIQNKYSNTSKSTRKNREKIRKKLHRHEKQINNQDIARKLKKAL